MPARSAATLTRSGIVRTIRCGAGSRPTPATMRWRCERSAHNWTALGAIFYNAATREPSVSIFQRIKAPFTESGEDEIAAAAPHQRPVGEILRERREELRLDINDIGEILRIKPAFLAALEQSRPEDLPGPTYVIGFVRAYARHLRLDHDPVQAAYKAESAGAPPR